MSPLDRRRFLQLSGATTAALALSTPTIAFATDAEHTSNEPQRGWIIYVDPRLANKAEAYRKLITAATTKSPLLQALASGQLPLTPLSDTPTQPELAFNHVLLIALPNDPLLLQAWQHEAMITTHPQGPADLYAFGFGHLQGSIGYIESDRNPFLHAAAVARAPYETQWISITGTDRIGLDLAVNAFLNHGLVNGLVAAPGWKRGAPTLLDRDPLSPGFTPPDIFPQTLGQLRRIAITQIAEDEYRGVLADAGVTPRSIWQAKYYAHGQWDASGQFASFHHYIVGLHRRAYGNSVWAAQFASPAEAAIAAPRIAAAAKLTPSTLRWIDQLPPYAWQIPEMGDAASTGTLELYRDESWILLSAITNPI